MSEVELVREILRQVLGATRTIAKRFAPIASVEDFVSSEAGLEKLDAICRKYCTRGDRLGTTANIRLSAMLASLARRKASALDNIGFKKVNLAQNKLCGFTSALLSAVWRP